MCIRDRILVAPQNRVAVPVPEGWGSYNRDMSLDVDENDVAGAVTLADAPVEADALPSEDEMRQVIEGMTVAR